MYRRKTIAILLALFLGSFGVHKFYLRRTGEGVFYIMLAVVTRNIFGFPVSTILAFFDALSYLMMDQRTFDRRYNMVQMDRGYRPQSRTTKRYQPPTTTQRKAPTIPQRKRSNPDKKKGIKLLSTYDIPEAIDHLEKATAIDPRDAEVHFNLACAYSLTEKTKLSLQHLDQAIAMGYPRDEVYANDLLAYIRIQSAFKRFEAQGMKYLPQPGDDENPEANVILKEIIKEKQQRENR